MHEVGEILVIAENAPHVRPVRSRQCCKTPFELPVAGTQDDELRTERGKKGSGFCQKIEPFLPCHTADNTKQKSLGRHRKIKSPLQGGFV